MNKNTLPFTSRNSYKPLKFKVYQNYNTLNKNNKTLSIFTIVAVFAMGIVVQSYQNAEALTSTPNCAPNCIDNILDSLTEAQDEIDESDFSGLQVELAKAKSLVNQLKQLQQTTNVAGLE